MDASQKDEVQRLLEIVKKESFITGDFVLSSGAKSTYYFDGKMTSLTPEGAYLLGKILFNLLKDTDIQAIGGPTIGADPIVAAVAVISYLEGKSIPAFLVRGEQKEHGTQKRIEGHLPRGGKVAIVDDAMTKGGSLRGAIEAVEAEGCTVAKVIAMVDRREGAEDLRQNYDFVAIFSYDASSGELLPSL
ncbi:MAG: orotate phosphoribosyltransferase [Chloroflexi bacterium RBG_13_54_9]|nr:MAG: orotate phosphoribosyltransferase [Chloroflexi bacterium RBG_13_54_9]